MQNQQEGWHLLLVRPGKEQAALNNFRRTKLRAYWPNYETVRNRRSVIPGYLFVMGPADAAFWDAIERVEDIVNVARTYGGGLVTLRQSDMDTIRNIEEGLNEPVPGKSLHSFRTGDKVRFKDSSWPPGVVARSTGDGRLSVEVELMGRMVPVQVYPHQIEKG